MVARNLNDQYAALHNPPRLETNSHWSHPNEATSDIHSPYEHGFMHDSARYHNTSIGYRGTVGYLLPPPSLLSTSHQGIHVPDVTDSRPSFQRHSPLTHSPPPLLPDILPVSKASISVYDRIDSEHQNLSRESHRPYANKSFPVGQAVIKTTLSPSKSRPPRRSSANGVVACRQCRSRKIRCDSTRPGCDNCARRSTPCEYDAVPKRRGPDKRPGTRRRSCKKRPVEGLGSTSTMKKRKVGTDDDDTDDGGDFLKYEDGDRSASPIDKSVVLPAVSSLTINTEVPRTGLLAGSSSTETDSVSSLSSSHRSPEVDIVQGPSMDYHRRTWWDNLLDSYSHNRLQSAKEITADLSLLFSTHALWLPFINAHVFVQKLNDPNERMRIQPSLVIACLALATMIKSSELELGHGGRERARNLGDLANAELNAALNAGAIDHTLAEAALVLTVFEFCPHPAHSMPRANSHVVFLDNIIRAQSLTLLDSADPNVSTFTPRSVPSVRLPNRDLYDPPGKCSCASPVHSQVITNDFLPSFTTYLPPWDSIWSPAEVQKEECRRLCWSALSLVASQSVTFSAFDKEPPDLYLSTPSNFSILFPGEISSRPGSITHDLTKSSKESVWALYCRSMLLWCSCVRQKDDNGDRADFAVDAWQETQAIQDALETHTCSSNSSLIYSCREYLHNSRMSITTEFRRSLQGVDNGVKSSMFNRRHAREWLLHSEDVALQARASISLPGHAPGYALARSPLQVSWFTTQVSICLRLWSTDHSLAQALDVAKAFLISVNVLNTLFPCHALSRQRDELYEELHEACTHCGLPSPARQDHALTMAIHNAYPHEHI